MSDVVVHSSYYWGACTGHLLHGFTTLSLGYWHKLLWLSSFVISDGQAALTQIRTHHMNIPNGLHSQSLKNVFTYHLWTVDPQHARRKNVHEYFCSIGSSSGQQFSAIFPLQIVCILEYVSSDWSINRLHQRKPTAQCKLRCYWNDHLLFLHVSVEAWSFSV